MQSSTNLAVVLALFSSLLLLPGCSDDPTPTIGGEDDPCEDISSSDCPEERPRLDPDSCECVECAEDYHCQQADCVQGSCIELGDGHDCLEDGDCQLGQICHNADQCVELDCDFCTDDQICYGADNESEPSCSAPECSGGDDCSDGVCDEGICYELGDDECTRDDDCFGPSEICHFDGRDVEGVGVCATLEEPTHPYFTVLLEDVTQQHGEPGRCQNVRYGYETAGAKIYDIVLVDDDQVLAHGLVSQLELGENVDFTSSDHVFQIFDGTDPGFSGACPDVDTIEHQGRDDDYETTFSYNHVAALGCGGQLFVHFEDADGNPIVLDHGHTIEVYAYGEQCSLEHADQKGWGSFDSCQEVLDAGHYCPQSTSDPYHVHLCTERGDEQQIDKSSCDFDLTDQPAGGIEELQIAWPIE